MDKMMFYKKCFIIFLFLFMSISLPSMLFAGWPGECTFVTGIDYYGGTLPAPNPNAVMHWYLDYDNGTFYSEYKPATSYYPGFELRSYYWEDNQWQGASWVPYFYPKQNDVQFDGTTLPENCGKLTNRKKCFGPPTCRDNGLIH